jgi:SAM-dependent methyltransferase
MLTVRDRQSGEQFELAECPSCHTAFVQRRPPIEAMSAYYGAAYYSYRPEAPALQRIKTAVMERRDGRPTTSSIPIGGRERTLATLLPSSAAPGYPTMLPAGTVLDVGCGSGSALDVFRHFGWRTTGVEIGEEARAEARRRGHAALRALDDLAVEARFDVVRFWHSLEHLHDPLGALIAARSHMLTGGRLVIGVPNLDALSRRLMGRHWYAWDAPRHLYHFTRAGLAGLVDRAGFQVVRSRTYSDRGIVHSALLAADHASGNRLRLLARLEASRVLLLLSQPLDVITGRFNGDNIALEAVAAEQPPVSSTAAETS